MVIWIPSTPFVEGTTFNHPAMLPPLKLRSSSDEASPFSEVSEIFGVVTKCRILKGMKLSKNDWFHWWFLEPAWFRRPSNLLMKVGLLDTQGVTYPNSKSIIKNPGPQRSPVYHCLRNNNKKSRSVHQLPGASGMCPQLLHHWMGNFGVIWHRKCRWNPIFKKMCASELYQNLEKIRKQYRSARSWIAEVPLKLCDFVPAIPNKRPVIHETHK